MSLSALANAGVLSFMVLLVVLLAMSLSAIIGLPAWSASAPEENSRPAAAHRAPAPSGTWPPGPRASADAPGQSGESGYPAGDVAGPLPRQVPVPWAQVPGNPPWGPALEPGKAPPPGRPPWEPAPQPAGGWPG
jgi:hypothetical protein